MVNDNPVLPETGVLFGGLYARQSGLDGVGRQLDDMRRVSTTISLLRTKLASALTEKKRGTTKEHCDLLRIRSG